MTTMSPDGLALIGPMALRAIRGVGWDPDSVGGLTLGADPVSYAIAYASAVGDMLDSARGGTAPQRAPVRAFTVRKEAKAHGTGKLIEGPFEPTDRVVVIEDVITTGGSALRAVEAIRGAGATVIGVLAVVDREEGGRERIEAAGCGVVALARAAEIVARMSSQPS